MEEVELISRAACGNVEAPMRCFVGERSDGAVLARRRDHAQEHDIAFVTLERVGVAAYDLAVHHFLRAKLSDQQRFDLTRPERRRGG